MTYTERAYFILCWTAWVAGAELWWERWGAAFSRKPN